MMSEKKINDILMEIAFLEKPPLFDADLKENLGIDSLKKVELIVELEDSFNISIDENDLDPQNIKTVRDIHNLINKYIERN